MAVSEWLIQIFARKFHSPVFLSYIICLSLYIQSTLSGSVARRWAGNQKDLGSIPGPPPFQYHFSNNACVYSQRQDVPYVHIIVPSTRPSEAIQGLRLKNTMRMSQRAHTWPGKVHKSHA